MARFFAAGHGEFAAFVPGGHTDIFKEKQFFDFLLFFSFCPYSFLIYALFLCLFPSFRHFSFSFFPIFSLKELNHTELRHG